MELSLYGDSSYKICLLNQSDVHKKLVRNNGILTKFIYFCECNFDIYIYIYTYTIFSVVRYAIRIILCTKSFIVRVYRKYSWIVWYISAYRMNCIVLVNRTIHGHVGLKWVFLLKFVVLFDLNKLLEFVNTKLLGNLIESNEIASPWVFFLPSLSPTKFKLYS